MIVLHSYWRSSAAYRVRIALNLKGIDYTQVTHDLRIGAQRDPAYLAIAPQGLVPAIETQGGVLTQSPAILEWIEEQSPKPTLLPSGTFDRGIVRSMMAVIGCDIHPVNNLRILGALTESFDATDAQRNTWIQRWIADGFDALETMIRVHGAGFAFGDQPTFADCFLVPQAYNAERFDLALNRWPSLEKAVLQARQHPAFAAAHPQRQPDADPG